MHDTTAPPRIHQRKKTNNCKPVTLYSHTHTTYYTKGSLKWASSDCFPWFRQILRLRRNLCSHTMWQSQRVAKNFRSPTSWTEVRRSANLLATKTQPEAILGAFFLRHQKTIGHGRAIRDHWTTNLLRQVDVGTQSPIWALFQNPPRLGLQTRWHGWHGKLLYMLMMWQNAPVWWADKFVSACGWNCRGLCHCSWTNICFLRVSVNSCYKLWLWRRF